MPARRPRLNPYVRPNERRILLWMRDEDKKDDGEQLTKFNPGGWWMGDEMAHAPSCFGLIRLCLISCESRFGKDTAEYWRINSEGEAVLDNPDYVPHIFSVATAVPIPGLQGRGKRL